MAIGGDNIFWYLPNIIDYFRVVTVLIGFAVAFDSPTAFGLLYLVSFLLDGVDGYAARRYSQCSQLGTVLDMITDRFSTAGLCLILSHMFPFWTFGFILLNVLDFCSHWFKMYVSLLLNQPHKTVNRKQYNVLLYHYYSNRIVLGGVCLGNELFYLVLYFIHWAPGSLLLRLALLLCAPVWAFKQVTNVIQLTGSMSELVAWEHARKGRK